MECFERLNEVALLKLFLKRGELFSQSFEFPSQFHNLRFELCKALAISRFRGGSRRFTWLPGVHFTLRQCVTGKKMHIARFLRARLAREHLGERRLATHQVM